MPEWIATFIAALGSALVAALISSIVAKVQLGGKKIREKLQQERKEEVTEIVTTVIENRVIPEIKKIKEDVREIKASNDLTKEGLQAVLRDRLLQLHRFCTEQRCKNDFSKAYSTISEKQNFDNMYQKYHRLGANGVMDHTYEAFMGLPDIPSESPKSKTRRTTKK